MLYFLSLALKVAEPFSLGYNSSGLKYRQTYYIKCSGVARRRKVGGGGGAQNFFPKK